MVQNCNNSVRRFSQVPDPVLKWDYCFYSRVPDPVLNLDYCEIALNRYIL